MQLILVAMNHYGSGKVGILEVMFIWQRGHRIFTRNILSETRDIAGNNLFPKMLGRHRDEAESAR
jgi:predicted RNA-binding protein